jgi:tetratricopeptide (TPR) repeat protein
MGRLGDGLKRLASAPLRALLPKNPLWRWFLILLPILILLAFLEPAANLVLKLVDFLLRLIEPLLQTTVGRVVLLLIAFLLGGLVAAALLRTRIRTFRGRVLLGRHLQGVAALLRDDHGVCRELFLRVARQKRVQPGEYPALAQDANLKLARLSLQDGDVDAALGWVARVVEPGLPRELRRSLLQLRLQALREQGAALPETLEDEARGAVKAFPDDYVLHRELRALLSKRGDLRATAELQVRVHQLAPPAAQAREQERLCDDLMAAGRAAIDEGDPDAARKLQKRLAKIPGPAGGLLLGAIHAAAGDVRAAIKAFGGTRSPEGLDRIAELLAENPGCIEVRELLECCPMQGTLLLVARELARQGQLEAARRAAQQAAETLGPTPTVCAVLAEVLQLLGREQEARLLAEQAVQRLLSLGAAAS